jgi:phosphoglycerol transferase MdoB-like AlkP superfamily enzyme
MKFDFLNKIMKYKYNFSPILYNRFVLYFICLIAIIDVVYLTTTGDVQSLVVFVLVGLLISFFSKNMIVILVIAMCVAQLLKFGTSNRIEGLENSTDADAGDDVSAGADADADATADADADADATEPAKKDKKVSKAEVMDSYNEYQGVQKDIVTGIERIQPLLEKAENFIQKYESYKGMEGYSEKFKEKMRSKR